MRFLKSDISISSENISFDMEVDGNASNIPEEIGTMTQNCLGLIEYINESGLLIEHSISEIELWETLDENNGHELTRENFLEYILKRRSAKQNSQRLKNIFLCRKKLRESQLSLSKQ
jgi:hypothetical protein|tara:strand:- start:186 stop:536 length:351 start_codon:yes stop_codon:yes gene_type:complete